MNESWEEEEEGAFTQSREKKAGGNNRTEKPKVVVGGGTSDVDLFFSTGVRLFIGSQVLCVFCLEICTPGGRGGEKGGSASFKTKHIEPLTQETPSALYMLAGCIWRCFRLSCLFPIPFPSEFPRVTEISRYNGERGRGGGSK